MTIVSGTVYDENGNPAPGRKVRAYKRDDGSFLAETTTSSSGNIGEYQLDINYTGEINILFLDDGTEYNDIVQRVVI